MFETQREFGEQIPRDQPVADNRDSLLLHFVSTMFLRTFPHGAWKIGLFIPRNQTSLRNSLLLNNNFKISHCYPPFITVFESVKKLSLLLSRVISEELLNRTAVGFGF
jgi:hypothetical protein